LFHSLSSHFILAGISACNILCIYVACMCVHAHSLLVSLILSFTDTRKSLNFETFWIKILMGPQSDFLLPNWTAIHFIVDLFWYLNFLPHLYDKNSFGYNQTCISKVHIFLMVKICLMKVQPMNVLECVWYS
jgi:hypothetical protein